MPRRPRERRPLCQFAPGSGMLCAWWECGQTAHPDLPINLCMNHAELAGGLILDGMKRAARLPDVKQPRRPRDPDRLGMVYFLRVGELVKIGWASDLSRRLRSYPPDAELLAVIPNVPIAEEARQHSDMRAFKARGREWYQPHPEGVRLAPGGQLAIRLPMLSTTNTTAEAPVIARVVTRNRAYPIVRITLVG